MSPKIIFYGGIVVCIVATIGALVAMIILRLSKTRINRQLDDEYGKRR